jgi:hypothetical protein
MKTKAREKSQTVSWKSLPHEETRIAQTPPAEFMFSWSDFMVLKRKIYASKYRLYFSPKGDWRQPLLEWTHPDPGYKERSADEC